LELGTVSLSNRQKAGETFEKVFRLFPVLKERLNQLGGTLSGGEQQMLAIGRALMANPKLLMMDEPSLGLAPLLVSQIFKTIAKLKDGGKTILLVEQNARKALLMSDRCYLLENGRVTMKGPSGAMINDQRVKESYLGGGLMV
jgi:branched-chain amino acid transport system ATP-binding protein